MVRVKRDATLPSLPTGKTLSELAEGFVTKISGTAFLVGAGPAAPRRVVTAAVRDVPTASCPPYPDAAPTRVTPTATRETARANNLAAARRRMLDVAAPSDNIAFWALILAWLLKRVWCIFRAWRVASETRGYAEVRRASEIHVSGHSSVNVSFEGA